MARSHAHTAAILDALDKPFAAGQLDERRRRARALAAAELQGCGPRTVAALHDLEPWTMWEGEILTLRRDCYASAMDPRAARAQRELDAFLEAEPIPLVTPQPRSPSGSSSNPR